MLEFLFLLLALLGPLLELVPYVAVLFLCQICVTFFGFLLVLAKAVPSVGLFIPSLEGLSLEVRQVSPQLPLVL